MKRRVNQTQVLAEYRPYLIAIAICIGLLVIVNIGLVGARYWIERSDPTMKGFEFRNSGILRELQSKSGLTSWGSHDHLIIYNATPAFNLRDAKLQGFTAKYYIKGPMSLFTDVESEGQFLLFTGSGVAMSSAIGDVSRPKDRISGIYLSDFGKAALVSGSLKNVVTGKPVTSEILAEAGKVEGESMIPIAYLVK